MLPNPILQVLGLPWAVPCREVLPLPSSLEGSPGPCQPPLAVPCLPRWPLGGSNWVCSLHHGDCSPCWLQGILGNPPGIPSGSGAAVLPVATTSPEVPAALSHPCLAQVWLREQNSCKHLHFPQPWQRSELKGGIVPGVLQCLEGTGSPGDTPETGQGALGTPQGPPES